MNYHLAQGSSVFMDGTGNYYLREVGKPGIIATVILPLDIGDALCRLETVDREAVEAHGV